VSITAAPDRRRLFLLWLAVCYAAWGAIVVAGRHWDLVVHHWETALAMALGSYVAGSTPMGGGTIGFPVLVLVLGEPAELGRGFSLAVQSIGMVSASIYILTRRRPIEWTLLKGTLAGALVSTPLAAWLVAPHTTDLEMKLLFAVIWCSFGILHLVKVRAIVRAEGLTQIATRLDREIGVAIGVLGGVASAIVGVGIDMLIYSALVLLYRSDLRIAIPTSVIAMACTSVVGLVSHAALGQVNPGVFGHWLAAAPVVALGAPLGALAVSHLPRMPTLLFVSALCVGQFVWTVVQERVIGVALIGALAGVLAFNAVFHTLWIAGGRLERRMPHLRTEEVETV
jgi:uncharacterized membrane protein YfcA